MSVAPHIKEIMNSKDSSAIRKMFEEGTLLKQKYGSENVFDFSIGNPDLEPPKQVIQTIKDVALSSEPGCHGYMANAGYPEVRAAIAKKVSNEQGVSLDFNHIVMSAGAAGALNTVFKALLSPEDQVIVPAPFFAEYGHYVRNHGGKLIPVATKKDFSLDIDAIKSALSEKTAVVLINSPNNPSGKIYSLDEIKLLCDVLKQHGNKCGRMPCLLCDEPYRDIVYDGFSVAPVFSTYEYSIIVSSFAKNLSLPGERIGYIAVNSFFPDSDQVIAACIFCARTLGFVNAPAFFQRVVAKSWNVQLDFSSYTRRKEMLLSVLDTVGVEYAKPEGAFYVFCKVPLKKNHSEIEKNFVEDDNLFCSHLKDFLILCAPGSGFGMRGWFRMAFCVPETVILNCKNSLSKAITSWYNSV
ncbi:MAG: pyridoxal phosphate-dependent aminotransferase [Spirochaetaceae bacterium]|nr:pyridoxal phosphate-dependent aminotransferase [Spirochaetaceae bacterium]